MAITRTQQAKQLLANGGRIGFKGGADASMADFGTPSTPGVSAGRKGPGPAVGAGGASFNKDDNFQTLSSIDEGVRRRNQLDLDNAAIKKGEDALQKLYDEGVPKSNMPGLLGLGLNATKKLRDFTLKKNIGYFEDLNTTKYPKTLEGYTQYMQDRSAGLIDAAGNTIMTGGDDPFIPIDQMSTNMDQAPEEPEVDPDSLEGMLANRVAYRFMADGGMTNDAPVEGGIMDLESGRQMYFLGKLVKKATRAVKKIAKSPIGKAALLYAGGSFLGGGGGGLTSIFGKDAFLRKTLLPKLYSGGKMTGLGKIALGGALTAAPLLFQQEEEEPDYASNRGPGLDINAIRGNPYETMGGAYRFYAEGGKAEPVAKETMPLIDMDGKEMDLRADGGFVPIGRMERADDVPARLSKNEFVFTADAVRNAGEGDIDKGAEVMYNMMKNLESGGEVSEESQGLDGAREMFQTSQRLEEVL